MSSNGKMHFVGCLEWKVSDAKHSHIFLQIPSLVHEELLKELFQFHTIRSDDAQAYAGPCSFLVSPRVGHKLKKCREWAKVIITLSAV